MAKFFVKNDDKQLSVDEGSSILSACEKEETSIVFGCKNGSCGSCLIKVLQNPQNLSPMSKNEKMLLKSIAATSDERLACQCKILGDVGVEVPE